MKKNTLIAYRIIYKFSRIVFLLPFLFITPKANAQVPEGGDHLLEDMDFIAETEDAEGSEKVFHAEPLFRDLIRDLGSRKGEQAVNLIAGAVDKGKFILIETNIQYEFSPFNRLAFEIEIPLSFYYNPQDLPEEFIPDNGIEKISFGTQWTFLVSQKNKLSMAAGYIHDFETNFSENTPVNGHQFHPLLVVAKRWGINFHTMVMGGPVFSSQKDFSNTGRTAEINTSFHYMLPGTPNFLGLELNKEFYKNDFQLFFRPQVQVEITDGLMIGLIPGIAYQDQPERFSFFTRLIWEPS